MTAKRKDTRPAEISKTEVTVPVTEAPSVQFTDAQIKKANDWLARDLRGAASIREGRVKAFESKFHVMLGYADTFGGFIKLVRERLSAVTVSSAKRKGEDGKNVEFDPTNPETWSMRDADLMAMYPAYVAGRVAADPSTEYATEYATEEMLAQVKDTVTLEQLGILVGASKATVSRFYTFLETGTRPNARGVTQRKTGEAGAGADTEDKGEETVKVTDPLAVALACIAELEHKQDVDSLRALADRLAGWSSPIRTTGTVEAEVVEEATRRKPSPRRTGRKPAGAIAA